MVGIDYHMYKNLRDLIFLNLELGWTKSTQLDHPRLIPATVLLQNLKLQRLVVADGSQDLLPSKIL